MDGDWWRGQFEAEGCTVVRCLGSAVTDPIDPADVWAWAERQAARLDVTLNSWASRSRGSEIVGAFMDAEGVLCLAVVLPELPSWTPLDVLIKA